MDYNGFLTSSSTKSRRNNGGVEASPALESFVTVNNYSILKIIILWSIK